MLFKATPEDVRMIMIDPKMLELSIYEGIPHLLAPVVTDMKLAANALNWCVNEMEKRYRLMSHVGVRNLAGFNQKIMEAVAQGMKIANPFSLTPDNPEPLEKLPFIEASPAFWRKRPTWQDGWPRHSQAPHAHESAGHAGYRHLARAVGYRS